MPKASELSIPEVFGSRPVSPGDELVAPEPADVWGPNEDVPIDRWLFGQFNRLLPGKASCRALSNLLLDDQVDSSLTELAGAIARDASLLGDVLATRDRNSGIARDEALATAFPTSGGPNSERGVLRYSNQFVVSVNSNGQLSGLLVGLKLINRVGGPKSPVSLTEAGWGFARLPNPILDAGEDGHNGKFSDDEIQLMLKHIRDSVPAESFAYKKILEAIESGHKSPDSLDAALASLKSKDDASKSFLASQRSGAVSRMSDLGLVERVRSGVRVEYAATDVGRHFLSLTLQSKD